MIPSFLRWLFNSLFKVLAEYRFEGSHNLPPNGPYLLVINHLSRLDVPFVYGLIGGAHITGWAAEKYRRHPLFAPIVRLGGGAFIERGTVDRSALSFALDWLARGNVFAMAPEGTRSDTGGLLRGKTGAAYLAHQANVAVVPGAIMGTETMVRDMLRLHKSRLAFRVGEPFRFPPLPEEGRSTALRRHTDEIMCRIAALLDPAYRGVYAGHPRLKELLAPGQTQPP
jgi:1-acyl-sn-glycerol-3-phosphate acyltransferase